MKINMYNIKARIFPSILTIIIPIIIFNYFYLSEELSNFFNYILTIKIISDLTISIITLLLLSQVSRFIGKEIFQKIFFKDEIKMPTTQFLLFSDTTYSIDFKKDLHKKIYQDYKIKLSSEKEESLNELNARKKISEAVSLIRKKFQENYLLKQHNIEYGALRNGLGGSLIGIILSLFNMYFFKFIQYEYLAIILSIISFCLYFLFLLLSKILINFFGKNYAKILFREYFGQ